MRAVQMRAVTIRNQKKNERVTTVTLTRRLLVVTVAATRMTQRIYEKDCRSVFGLERKTEETRLNIVDFADAVEEETAAEDPLYRQERGWVRRRSEIMTTVEEFLRASDF
jgi:hypothetical protein